ncbi:MAG: DMT family transporter [Alphaproteobacteria bacterium]|nr:DMT family transporter [Alphaproteobacteria bacterium]MBT4017906.1 DMT family transporter [Alphaproteobacteria bacterium]MBT7746077.1 DMT family transporter [Alphaproteobacteria bacterium]
MNIPPVLRAALWMSGALASFTFMALGGRELASELTTFQILFFRSVVGLILVSTLLTFSGWAQVRGKRVKLHLLRNTAHFGGQFGWFYGISLLPLSTVFALEFTAPVWTALLAVFVLSERLTMVRLMSILMGFGGILLILRPTVNGIGSAEMAVIGAAAGYAVAYVMTKKLGADNSPLTIIFYMTIIQLPLSFLPSLWQWTLPSMTLWPWVVLVGVTALSAHYCIARALALADAGVVVPMDFLRLPLITVIGFLLYDEAFDIWVLAGGAIIFVGNLINMREAARGSKS